MTPARCVFRSRWRSHLQRLGGWGCFVGSGQTPCFSLLAGFSSLSGPTDKDDDGWTTEWKGSWEDEKFDEEMDEFLLSKVKEGNAEENKLLNADNAKTPSSSISADALKEALSLCEDQLEKVKAPVVESQETKSPEPLEFSSKFGTFRADFMKELEGDVGLSELPIPVSSGSTPNGTVQDFMDGFAKSSDPSSIESCFAPESDKKFFERSFLGQRDDLDQITAVHKMAVPRTRVHKGGFQINVYRNLTGSIKELLTSMRQTTLQSVIKTVQTAPCHNEAFLNKLIETSKLQHAKMGTDMRRQMNQLCLSLLDCMQTLTPDEIALVCLVFGELGYTNSLVFYQLFSKLQKPETLANMSTESLSGTVLSLGMLQSMDPEFISAVQREFFGRVKKADAASISPNAFGSLMLGCNHSRERPKAEKFCSDLVEVMTRENLIRDTETVSWSDLAVALYVASDLNLVKPDLLKGIHARLTASQADARWDLTCVETSVLLLALENLHPAVMSRPLHSVWKELYTMLEDHVGNLIDQDKVGPTSVPDLVRSLSFPGQERVQYFKPLGRIIVEADVFSVQLPIWSLVFRLMAGYSNLRYRDPVALKALNKRFLTLKMGTVNPSTVASLLHLGCRLRGLDEAVVDRLMELLAPDSYFWTKVHRTKDAAKIAYSLAGLGKLTPGIFGECWKKCAAVPYYQYESMSPQESIDTLFITQGLFTGYQYIRQKFSPSVARKHISLKGHYDLYRIIKLKNLTEAGLERPVQKEVAKCLEGMGIALSSPALICDSLHRADVVLHDTKAVVFVAGDRSYFCNPPYEMTGGMLVLKRSLEGLKIKVVVVKESEWKTTPLDKKEELLSQCFSLAGLKVDKLRKKRKETEELDDQTSEDILTRVTEWLGMRGIVLNDLRKFQLVELLLSRSENIKKPENDAIEELAEESLMKNKVLKQRTSPTKSVRDRRKGDLIKEILAIEVHGLFGDDLLKIQPQSRALERSANLSQ